MRMTHDASSTGRPAGPLTSRLDAGQTRKRDEMHEMRRFAGQPLTALSAAALLMYVRVVHDDRERGDVPGWVLVTIMTAGLVTALWLVADDKLKQLFNDALDGVVGNAP